MTIPVLLPYLLFWTLWFVLTNALEYAFFRHRLATLASPYLNTANQVSNLLHAFVVIILGFYIMLFEFNLDAPLTFWQSELIAFSSSFFLVDTLALLLFRNKKMDILIHHLIVLGGYGMVSQLNESGWLLGSVVALGELGPCIYIENVARRWNIRSEQFYGWNDALYLISFLLSRLVGLTTLYYMAVFKTDSHLVLRILGALLLILSVYWSQLLVNRYIRRYPSSLFSQKMKSILGSRA